MVFLKVLFFLPFVVAGAAGALVALDERSKRRPLKSDSGKNGKRTAKNSGAAKMEVIPAPGTLRSAFRSLQQHPRLGHLVGQDIRSRQLKEFNNSGPLDGVTPSADVEEQEANHYFKVSSAALVLGIGSSAVPPLAIATGAMCVYSCVPLLRDAFQSLKREHRVRWTALECVALAGMLATGYVTAFALGCVIYFAGVKIMLRTEDRSRRTLRNVFGQQPRTVWIVRDGVDIEIPFDQLRAGATIVVTAGQTISVDGMVTEGAAAIDQHLLTGEAQPAEKGPGDTVLASSLVLTGRVLIRVDKAGAETVAAQIQTILGNTAEYRVAVQARWERLADKSVLPTVGLSAIAFSVLGPVGAVAALCCNYVSILQIAAPLGMLNFLQLASRSGLMVKDARVLEAVHTVDTVVFDKTGTLTLSQPEVTEVHAGCLTAEEVLTLAAAVEAHQDHPIARAIVQEAAARDLPVLPLDDARYTMGFGIEARIGGRVIRVGSERYLGTHGIGIPADLIKRPEERRNGGNSVVYVACDAEVAGAIELRPVLRPGAKDIVHRLRDMGLAVHIISGDHPASTEALAAELGVDRWFAEVLPPDKSRLVEELQAAGHRVCFVGDGINDAMALQKADVSVSLRGGSALAANTAQVVIMNESLAPLVRLFEVGRQFNTNTKATLGSAFVPGFISMGGVFFLHLGIYPVMMLYNVAMFGGIATGMIPALAKDEGNELQTAVTPTAVSSNGRVGPANSF